MAVGSDLDPYGIHPDLPKEKCQVQRNYFARPSGSDMWVHFDDSLRPPARSCRRKRHKISCYWERRQFEIPIL